MDRTRGDEDVWHKWQSVVGYRKMLFPAFYITLLTWPQAFISQALVESGLAEEEENKDTCIKALKWLDNTQIQDNPPHYEHAYRQATKGAWPFSTKEQGYTVSDCVGEGLKAVIYLQKHLSYVNPLGPHFH